MKDNVYLLKVINSVKFVIKKNLIRTFILLIVLDATLLTTYIWKSNIKKVADLGKNIYSEKKLILSEKWTLGENNFKIVERDLIRKIPKNIRIQGIVKKIHI